MDAETGLERKKKLEANKLKLVRAYKKVFETDEGKEVLHDIVFTACKIDLPAKSAQTSAVSCSARGSVLLVWHC